MKKLELATIIASRKIVRNFIWFYKLKSPGPWEPGGFRWIWTPVFHSRCYRCVPKIYHIYSCRRKQESPAWCGAPL